MKNNKLSKDQTLFKKVNNILAKSSYKYWVCHGTLLGIIRDKAILPWDHDIDFAVWKDEVKIEEIEKLFNLNGFHQEYIFGEMDCLHFVSESKKIDISFYEKKNGLASIKWIAPNNKFKNKFFIFVAERLCAPNNIKKSKFNFTSIKSFIRVLFSNFLISIYPFFSSKLKKKIFEYSQKYFNYIGYSYPEELMQFKNIIFLEEQVPVPIDSEKCLFLTYGADWKTPKKNYTWYKEAANLTKLS